MGPANMKRYQLFLWESTEWFPQKTQWPISKTTQYSLSAQKNKEKKEGKKEKKKERPKLAGTDGMSFSPTVTNTSIDSAHCCLIFTIKESEP